MSIDELVVGTVCGGSDATSGITANPAIGRAFDLLVEQRATAIFEETGELIGCEHIMAARAVNDGVGRRSWPQSKRRRDTTRCLDTAASLPETRTAG